MLFRSLSARKPPEGGFLARSKEQRQRRSLDVRVAIKTGHLAIEGRALQGVRTQAERFQLAEALDGLQLTAVVKRLSRKMHIAVRSLQLHLRQRRAVLEGAATYQELIGAQAHRHRLQGLATVESLGADLAFVVVVIVVGVVDGRQLRQALQLRAPVEGLAADLVDPVVLRAERGQLLAFVESPVADRGNGSLGGVEDLEVLQP